MERPHRPLRIAWFSDLPEAGSHDTSVSAYCSEQLLPELAERYEIECFNIVQHEVARVIGGVAFPVRHYLNAKRVHQERPFDLFVYQLEDGAALRWIRAHLGLMPGIAWFHDIAFQDLGVEAYHTSPWENSIRQVGDSEQPFLSRSYAPHQIRPFAHRELALSPVVLCSSRWALRKMQSFTTTPLEAFPNSQIREHLAIPVPCEKGGGVAASLRDGGAERSFATSNVAALEGHMQILLPALRELSYTWRLHWMISSAERSRAEMLLTEFGVAEQVVLHEGRSSAIWQRIVQGVDTIFHSYRGPFGHQGPYLPISLASDTAVVVLDAEEGNDLPDRCVLKVTPGLFEQAQITAILRDHAEILSQREVIRERQRYVAEMHGIENVAERFATILDEALPTVRHCMALWEQLQSRAGKAVMSENVRVLSQGDISGHPPLAGLLGW